SEHHLTGTDRLWEAAQHIEADCYVNLQGDEPLVEPDDIVLIAQTKQQYPNEVINGMKPLTALEDPDDVNIPKVITTESNRLVYMSRRALPGYKSLSDQPTQYYKQVCIYAFNKKELQKFGEFGRKGRLE